LKHELRGVLKYIGGKNVLPTPTQAVTDTLRALPSPSITVRDRHLSHDQSQIVTDIPSKMRFIGYIYKSLKEKPMTPYAN
jgi:hypothetical protein